MVQMVKNRSLGQEDPLEKGIATHSSILAWRIPWTKELGELQSMGSQRARHDRATKTLSMESSDTTTRNSCFYLQTGL